MKTHGKKLMTVLLVAAVVALGAGCTSTATKQVKKQPSGLCNTSITSPWMPLVKALSPHWPTMVNRRR